MWKRDVKDGSKVLAYVSGKMDDSTWMGKSWGVEFSFEHVRRLPNLANKNTGHLVKFVLSVYLSDNLNMFIFKCLVDIQMEKFQKYLDFCIWGIALSWNFVSCQHVDGI